MLPCQRLHSGFMLVQDSCQDCLTLSKFSATGHHSLIVHQQLYLPLLELTRMILLGDVCCGLHLVTQAAAILRQSAVFSVLQRWYKHSSYITCVLAFDLLTSQRRHWMWHVFLAFYMLQRIPED